MIFVARLKHANLVTKTYFDTKLISLNRKINSDKTKHLLIENELKKLPAFDSIYFKRGKSCFEEEGAQNYLIFQPMYRYFKKISGVGNGEYIHFWKPKCLFDESINSITLSNYSITPELSCYSSKIRVKFNGSCLKQDKTTYTHGTIENIYTVYEISKNFDISSYPTLENCFFGGVSLTKHDDIDEYNYSGYGIGFDRKGSFSFGNRFGRNVIIFVVDMSSSVHVDNKKKDIQLLSEGSTQGLYGTTLIAEKKYPISFIENNKRFCLSLDYNRGNSYLFVNDIEIIKFKAKDSETAVTPLCLGNISKKFSVDNMKNYWIKWIYLWF